jgi:hypothetical protein
MNDIEIERTFDTELVRSIMNDEELLKRSGDNLMAEVYDPDKQRDIYYLLPKYKGKPLGVLVCHVFISTICYQGHVNYLPKYWGKNLEIFTREAIKWMFENTDCRKLVSLAPDSYPEVLKHAVKCGLKKEGYLKNSVLSNGQLDNQTILGIEKWQLAQQ